MLFSTRQPQRGAGYQTDGCDPGLPLQFSGNNRSKVFVPVRQRQSVIAPVVDLTEKGKTRAVKQQNGANYTVVFTINADAPPPPPPVVAKRVEEPVYTPRPSEPARNPFKTDNDRITGVTSSNTVTRPAASARRVVSGDKVIIAIDAGHGGQDPVQLVRGTREKT